VTEGRGTAPVPGVGNPVPVGSSVAGRIVHLRPPLLRMRYRYGVYVDLRGYPDWLPYAAAMVRLAPVPRGLSIDEARLVDVLAANRLLAGAGFADRDPADDRTPAGWIWAHLGASRELALVPAELHLAFRHRGGISGLRPDERRRGPSASEPNEPSEPSEPSEPNEPSEPGRPLRLRAVRTVADDAIRKFATNGGVPTTAGVAHVAGFLVDQPFFALAAYDRAQDLAYVNTILGDRLTGDFLAVGQVQGGLLAVQVRGWDSGSVWYWDDDDPRDDERYEASVICRDLLLRCADDFPAFLARLTTVPPRLVGIVEAELVAPDGMGAALPRSRRPAWLRSAPDVRPAAPS